LIAVDVLVVVPQYDKLDFILDILELVLECLEFFSLLSFSLVVENHFVFLLVELPTQGLLARFSHHFYFEHLRLDEVAVEVELPEYIHHVVLLRSLRQETEENLQ